MLSEEKKEKKKPEEKAREKIDEQLLDAGWAVVDRYEYDNQIPSAIRE